MYSVVGAGWGHMGVAGWGVAAFDLSQEPTLYGTIGGA